MGKKKRGARNVVRLLQNVFFLALPTVASLFSVFFHVPRLGWLSFLFLIAGVALAPCCRGCESLWIFILAVFTAVPANMRFIYDLMSRIWEFPCPIVGFLALSLYANIALLSIEEIFLGIAGRLLWKRQRKLKRMLETMEEDAPDL